MNPISTTVPTHSHEMSNLDIKKIQYDSTSSCGSYLPTFSPDDYQN